MSGANIDLFDKDGKRITYIILVDHTMGNDIVVSGCVFKLDIDGKYKTTQNPLLMLQREASKEGVKSE